MKTIFVSGASGIVGYGVLRSLRNFGFKLIGSSIYTESAANCFSDKFVLAPKTSDSGYMDWLLNTIQKYNVDMVIPCIEDDMYLWNSKRDLISKVTCPLLNSARLINFCEDKWKFYSYLREVGFSHRIESSIDNNFDFLRERFGLPFLLKPRKGFASKGIVKIYNFDTYSLYQDKIGTELMAQPMVGDDEHEYTISAFFDKDSNLCCYHQLKRRLSKSGFTECAETVSLKNITAILTELADIFKPIGPTNFQFREDAGFLRLLEINPRISSSTSIRSALGYNESLMSVSYFIDGVLPVQPILKNGKAIRYIEDYILS